MCCIVPEPLSKEGVAAGALGEGAVGRARVEERLDNGQCDGHVDVACEPPLHAVGLPVEGQAPVEAGQEDPGKVGVVGVEGRRPQPTEDDLEVEGPRPPRIKGQGFDHVNQTLEARVVLSVHRVDLADLWWTQICF